MWQVGTWFHSAPLTLEKLRGKVVLLRWWTGPHCQFCLATAPVLNDLHKRYRANGLVVVGFFHDKTGPYDIPPQVRNIVEFIGFRFPVAVDTDWNTLKRYWLDRVSNTEWTSVSFLIDKQGIIRYIHPGGTITEEDAKHLEEEILRLLKTEE